MWDGAGFQWTTLNEGNRKTIIKQAFNGHYQTPLDSNLADSLSAIPLRAANLQYVGGMGPLTWVPTQRIVPLRRALSAW